MVLSRLVCQNEDGVVTRARFHQRNIATASACNCEFLTPPIEIAESPARFRLDQKIAEPDGRPKNEMAIRRLIARGATGIRSEPATVEPVAANVQLAQLKLPEAIIELAKRLQF